MKNEALHQEQTGQVHPDKDVDKGVWSKEKPQDAPKTFENEQQQPTTQVRPEKPDKLG